MSDQNATHVKHTENVKTEGTQKPKKRFLNETILSAIIGALAIVIGAYIGTRGVGKQEGEEVFIESKFQENPRNPVMWNDSKEIYIWFNAQYRNANDFHDNNHYDSIVKQHIKFTFVLIQPDKKNQEDYRIFLEKFTDMRRFLRKMKRQGDNEHYDVSYNLGDVYMFKEEKTPAISFFITKSRLNGKEKAIVYFEEKFLMLDRRPEICLETYNTTMIKSLKSRIDVLLEHKTDKNKLGFDALISDAPDSTFILP